MSFQGKGYTEAISVEQKTKLIEIYKTYRNVFSDSPGKAKDFVCRLKFHDSVNFNKKSYPIAQSSKEAVRKEIARMIQEDIIERSNSPYTLSLIHI